MEYIIPKIKKNCCKFYSNNNICKGHQTYQQSSSKPRNDSLQDDDPNKRTENIIRINKRKFDQPDNHICI